MSLGGGLSVRFRTKKCENVPGCTDCIHFDTLSGSDWTLPLVTIGGLPIAVIDRARSAQLMIEAALARRDGQARPLIFTSANGQVLSLCAQHSTIRDTFLAADLIHADGMPLVFASRLFCRTPLPERVATTDLFHDAARLAQRRRARFFLLGATDSIMEQAAQRIRALYPDLELVGRRGGYLSCHREEARVIEDINNARPDILWLGLGVPREQEFALRHRDQLCGVGVIKTSGGLFDFLSGKNSRAPSWMQLAGLEWAYRTYLEPRRLAGRYLMTNPHAALLLLTRTGSRTCRYGTARTGRDP
jgi:N-acetylglucosaminyldiphosphoundecaprenol N-acetyl-beta-D-mannosaminyltransferase